jgi:hypothetical protein
MSGIEPLPLSVGSAMSDRVVHPPQHLRRARQRVVV